METLKKRGRPRLDPSAARGPITLSISADLRSALETEAALAGCSMSQAAIGWLARGRLLAAAERALLKFGEGRDDL
jgi:hypothetical protein